MLSIPDSFGPRILSLRRHDGPDLFAALADDVVIDRPDSGVYRFRGGHRLWAAPERPELTYAPDDDECEIVYGRGSVAVRGPVDRAGLEKSLQVMLDGGALVVDNTLTNRAGTSIEVAAWAITQFRMGGIAFLPLGSTQGGLQGDRSLTLWPYTDPTDSRLTIQPTLLTIAARPGPAFKIGAGPNPRRLGYLLDGYLFQKEFAGGGDNLYADRGAVGQVFVESQFCELESLGELTRLAPGERISHRETWSLAVCDGVETAGQRLVAI